MKKNYLYIWIISFLIGAILSSELTVFFKRIFSAFFLISLLIYFGKSFQLKIFPYILFFLITVTSIIGLTNTLTGSLSYNTNNFLYGLSFYSVGIAYLYKKNELKYLDILKLSNPLILITGPISLYFKNIRYKNLNLRLSYFFPYVLIGVFYFYIIASPLTVYFSLIEKTDIVSSIIFAIIFEVFVYSNFCGLSLILYGAFGMVGFKIPLNFKQPFSSRNIVEFWKGWHITLSKALKELFYKPLRKKNGLFFTLIIVFLSSAIWHGVSINFLIWGILHSISFYITVILNKLKFSLKYLISAIVMFISVIIGRLIFADSNVYRLLEKLQFNYSDFSAIDIFYFSPTSSFISLILGIILIFVEFIFKNHKNFKNRNYKYLRLPQTQIILFLIFLLLIMKIGSSYAIYGQR